MIVVVRAVFYVGFLFLIVVAAWGIIVITRIKREHQVAMSILNALAAKAGLQREGDRIQLGGVPMAARDEKKPQNGIA